MIEFNFYRDFISRRLSRFRTAIDDTQQDSFEDTRQLIKQAEKLTRKGEMAQAEEILRRVLKVDPQESKAKLALAYVLLKQRRLIEAYDLFV